jgi:hypothetical protein
MKRSEWIWDQPRHADRVQAIVEGRAPAMSELGVSTSWNRCVTTYKLDPAAGAPPRILTCAELKDHRKPLDQLIGSAADELDRLFWTGKHAILGCTARAPTGRPPARWPTPEKRRGMNGLEQLSGRALRGSRKRVRASKLIDRPFQRVHASSIYAP